MCGEGSFDNGHRVAEDKPCPLPPPYRDDAARAAAALASAGRKIHLEVITSSYDTAFAAIGPQVVDKAQQLAGVFPPGGPVHVGLVVVDDTDQKTNFGPAARQGAARARGLLAGGIEVQPLFYRAPGPHGQKGLALREGMLTALDRGADAVCYVNLNRKVDAAQVATALDVLVRGPADVVIGTRAPADGGRAQGAGRIGRAKSRAWSRLVRATFPVLDRFADQNAPLKLLPRPAAQHLLRTARIDGVTLDAEWLVALLDGGYQVAQVPICWQQQPRSKVPFGLVPSMLVDLGRLRRARSAGRFRPTS